jgi:hypothetical protein
MVVVQLGEFFSGKASKPILQLSSKFYQSFMGKQSITTSRVLTNLLKHDSPKPVSPNSDCGFQDVKLPTGSKSTILPESLVVKTALKLD